MRIGHHATMMTIYAGDYNIDRCYTYIVTISQSMSVVDRCLFFRHQFSANIDATAFDFH